jgi:hypothetical protein
MSDLKSFFLENAEKVENEKYVASTRFKDGKGKPVEWEIRCLTNAEVEKIKAASQKKSNMQTGRKKKGLSIDMLDVPKYLKNLAVAAIVYPDLHDADLQNSYSVKDASALYDVMLTPGEAQDLTDEVQQICGFDVDFDDKVNEAKNS